jgi:hypothetical protein
MLQLAKMQERKNSLRRRINAWTTVQHLYMPEISSIRARTDRAASDTSAEIAPYNLPLHLPSSLPARVPCPPTLLKYELKLREAQCYEALDELRDHLRLRTHMYKYKNKNIVGQRANTRCQNMIHSVQEKVNASATKYRTARAALMKLSSHSLDDEGWRARLLTLDEEDIRPLKEGEEGESEGTRTLSWIWKVVGVGGDSDNEGLQEGEYRRFLSPRDDLTKPPFQHYGLNGVEAGPGRCVFPKRSRFCAKKCAGFWHFWIGMRGGGMSGDSGSQVCPVMRRRE